MENKKAIARPLSLAEQVANNIAELVLSGEFKPGDSIPEPRLAAYFQVSRGPVREALRILEKDGVVTISPRRGARVTKLTAAELDQVFEIRATLFGLAAGLFSNRHAPADLDRLQQRLDQMRALVSAGGATEAHAQLSLEMASTLLEGCGNPRLREMVLQLSRQVARYTRLGLSSVERRRQSLESWEALIGHIRSGEAESAEALARRMVMNSRKHALEMLAQEEAAASG